MASTLSRRLLRTLIASPRSSSHLMRFPSTSYSICSKSFSTEGDDLSALESDRSGSESESEVKSDPLSSTPEPDSNQRRNTGERPLENGMDNGIYKAILVGQVGQAAIQKKLKSGNTVTLLSIGTGGIRNNRRPFDNEEPREYADRCAVQWHRVSIYPQRLGDLAAKNAIPGSILYIEGNLETKVFSDPITGLVRRIREVAVRQNGRLVFLGKLNDAEQPSKDEIKSVGYY
ncbi:PREDICTED: single-stranded DNA-binding protein, mitochondrial isoform X1 [Ipomoea nil]|uniref:single-stranded DNA-binding protein, mitochondrial isoform X1 n=1 Tax=Ipomoea nil TaxID=35883 RepID=UPI000901EBBC|nr:PREDICTED: single-stranded DNA-binding protein, mitochondrial isoform X1 [Ipomoea nil]